MSGLPWFRMYAEAVDDEKLRLLAFEDRWHYMAILCCKCAGLLDAGNSQEMLRRKMTVKLGLAQRDLEAAVIRLAEVGLVDAETMQPAAWDRRQFKSDADLTALERKKRQRSKDKPHVTDVSRVTPAVTVTNVTRTDTDTDTDTERDTEEPKKKHSKRGARLPDDFEPDSALRQWASSEFPQVNLKKTVEEFVDHWRAVPGARGCKLDWQATLRNRVRAKAEYQAGKPNASDKRNHESVADRASRFADEGDEAERRRTAQTVGAHGSDLRP